MMNYWKRLGLFWWADEDRALDDLAVTTCECHPLMDCECRNSFKLALALFSQLYRFSCQGQLLILGRGFWFALLVRRRRTRRVVFVFRHA